MLYVNRAAGGLALILLLSLLVTSCQTAVFGRLAQAEPVWAHVVTGEFIAKKPDGEGRYSRLPRADMIDARTTRLLRKLHDISPLNFEADEIGPGEIEIYPTTWGHRIRTDCSACRMAEYVAQAATDTRIRVQWLRSENRIHGFRVQ